LRRRAACKVSDALRIARQISDGTIDLCDGYVDCHGRESGCKERMRPLLQ
jgi:hypothetical protein